MSLHIVKAGRGKYMATSFKPSGVLEWSSEKAMYADELMKILVGQYGYHQLDVLDALKDCDPHRYSVAGDLRKVAEKAIRGAAVDDNLAGARELIERWLRQQDANQSDMVSPESRTEQKPSEE